MTDQDAFNTMVNHLRAQGKRSTDGRGCRYRGLGGLKCAIGALIPDEKYDACIEGYSVDAAMVLGLLNQPELDVDMLLEMQELHDKMEVKDWASGFVHVAKRYHLALMPQGA